MLKTAFVAVIGRVMYNSQALSQQFTLRIVVRAARLPQVIRTSKDYYAIHTQSCPTHIQDDSHPQRYNCSKADI
jgi:hypothetical protein